MLYANPLIFGGAGGAVGGLVLILVVRIVGLLWALPVVLVVPPVVIFSLIALFGRLHPIANADAPPRA